MTTSPSNGQRNSTAAYFAIRDSLPARRAEAYTLVYKHGPATAAEMVHAAELTSVGGRGMAGNLHARLNELLEQDVVCVSGVRDCRVTGHSVNEYDITGRGPKKRKLNPARFTKLSKRSLEHLRDLWQRYPEDRANIERIEWLARADYEAEEQDRRNKWNENRKRQLEASS